jgi:hypothetical protein
LLGAYLPTVACLMVARPTPQSGFRPCPTLTRLVGLRCYRFPACSAAFSRFSGGIGSTVSARHLDECRLAAQPPKMGRSVADEATDRSEREARVVRSVSHSKPWSYEVARSRASSAGDEPGELCSPANRARVTISIRPCLTLELREASFGKKMGQPPTVRYFSAETWSSGLRRRYHKSIAPSANLPPRHRLLRASPPSTVSR